VNTEDVSGKYFCDFVHEKTKHVEVQLSAFPLTNHDSNYGSLLLVFLNKL